jgi:hypothetical protein
VHPRLGQQPAAEPQPRRRVVVAGAEDHRRAGLDDAHERVIEQAHRVRSGHCPVVDVAGHEHHIDALGAHRVDQVVQEQFVSAAQLHTVQPAAQMPVGGVEQTHTGRL